MAYCSLMEYHTYATLSFDPEFELNNKHSQIILYVIHTVPFQYLFNLQVVNVHHSHNISPCWHLVQNRHMAQANVFIVVSDLTQTKRSKFDNSPNTRHTSQLFLTGVCLFICLFCYFVGFLIFIVQCTFLREQIWQLSQLMS